MSTAKSAFSMTQAEKLRLGKLLSNKGATIEGVAKLAFDKGAVKYSENKEEVINVNLKEFALAAIEAVPALKKMTIDKDGRRIETVSTSSQTILRWCKVYHFWTQKHDLNGEATKVAQELVDAGRLEKLPAYNVFHVAASEQLTALVKIEKEMRETQGYTHTVSDVAKVIVTGRIKVLSRFYPKNSKSAEKVSKSFTNDEWKALLDLKDSRQAATVAAAATSAVNEIDLLRAALAKEKAESERLRQELADAKKAGSTSKKSGRPARVLPASA